MIVLGVIFRCLDPMLIIGAAGAERSIFLSPLDARAEAREKHRAFARGTGSDHMMLINAVREMRQVAAMEGDRAQMAFARRNFLHMGGYRSIDSTAKQIEGILVEAGLIPYTSARDQHDRELGHPTLNQNASKVPLIKALTLAGVHPNLGVNVSPRMYRTRREKNAMLHPSSVNYSSKKNDTEDLPRNGLIVYSAMMRSADGGSTLVREVSAVSPLMTALFGGRLQEQATGRSSRSNVVEMDSWLPFYVRDDMRSGGRDGLKTVVEFRKALDRLLTGSFMDLQKRGAESRGYLADDRTREEFARGLVEVC